MVTEERARRLNDRPLSAGPVVYWMSRDQRAADNWALLHAQRQALLLKAPLAVVFCLAPKFLGATMRHYGFMLRGLEETSGNLQRKGVPFFLLAGDPAREIPAFASLWKAALVITDFDPLRIKVRWKARAGSALRVPLVEVDAHNIVPCWTASGKGEYAAYTFRPRILGRLERFLVPFPRLKGHPFPWPGKVPVVDWGGVLRGLKIDRGVGEVRWIRPGERAARRALKRFLQSGLDLYAERRNDPSGGGQSDLSPYLHFGQLSAQRVALEVRNSGGDPHSV
ncbi:MAG: deoxyribodipyrimidine photo-lyase, partial [bacterium]